MKKVVLTGAAFIAFATASLAQNTATVNQIGNTQTGTVTQTGNLQTGTITQTTTGAPAAAGSNFGNTGAIIQSGGTLGNTGTINQRGGPLGVSAQNQSTIDQSNGASATGGNNATVTQDNNSGGPLKRTDNSFGPLSGDPDQGSIGNITQSGGGNGATIEQSNFAGTNLGVINQTGNNNIGTTINQSNNSENNSAQIDQVGNGNEADVSQYGNGTAGSNFSRRNQATVTQGTGSPLDINNKAVVDQNAGSDGSSTNNTTIIYQETGSQAATVSQSNNSFSNQATVFQLAGGANGSDAFINQDGITGSSSSNNQATIGQSGSGQKGTIVQSGGFAGASVGNVANINQGDGGTAGGNTSFINQSTNSAYNNAMTEQTGNGDKATVTQTDNSNYNNATIYQGGTGSTANEATITQINAGVGSGTTAGVGGNQAEIRQNVAGDIADFTRANGTTASFASSGPTVGSGNIAVIEQGLASFVGGTDANQATIMQQNSNNQARLRQTGGTGAAGGNIAGIDQRGDGNVVTGPGGFAIQSGNGNTLDVIQMRGAGSPGINTANVNQVGNSNTASIMQTGL